MRNSRRDLRDLGAALAPDEFLSARARDATDADAAHVDNALAVARFLAAARRVERGRYAGLATAPRRWGKNYLQRGAARVFCFEVPAGEMRRAFIESLQIFHTSRTSATRGVSHHPARYDAPAARRSERGAGIGPGTIRLSIASKRRRPDPDLRVRSTQGQWIATTRTRADPALAEPRVRLIVGM